MLTNVVANQKRLEATQCAIESPYFVNEIDEYLRKNGFIFSALEPDSPEIKNLGVTQEKYDFCYHHPAYRIKIDFVDNIIYVFHLNRSFLNAECTWSHDFRFTNPGSRDTFITVLWAMLKADLAHTINHDFEGL